MILDMGEPVVGDILGSYQLEAEIGEGGSARLFRARHINPALGENIVALKLLRATHATDPDFVKRFRTEAYLLSTMAQANIVETYEAGIEGDDLYIAMEYVHGCDFADVLTRHSGPLPEVIALHVVRMVLRALDYAHTHTRVDQLPVGVVHRDVKPSNVLISSSGRIKLTDFGIASLLGAKQVPQGQELLGTLGYFAPEQLEGVQADHRSDIFSLGVVLYEAVCGVPPFGEDTGKLLKRNRRAHPKRPRRVNEAISSELEAVILHAMARRPNRRYASCREMLRDLDQLAPHPVGMELAVAALVHDLFADSFALASGPWRRSPEDDNSGRGTIVAVCTRDEETKWTLSRSIRPLGAVVTYHRSATRLPPPRGARVIVVDVDDEAFSAAALLAHLESLGQPEPILAICSELSPQSVGRADSIGAADLLIRPLRQEVVVGALRRQLRRREQETPPPSMTTTTAAPLQRVLLITGDDALTERLTEELNHRTVTLERVTRPSEALLELNQRLFRAVICDRADSKVFAPDLARRLRSAPGVGLMPVLFLEAPGAPGPSPALPPRTACRSRESSSMLLAAALQQLRTLTQMGRADRRWPVTLAADLSFRGRSVACELINISRGGALLRVGQMPALHTLCRLTIHPRPPLAPLTILSQVIRLALDEQGDTAAKVALQFCPSDRAAEGNLIELISWLSDRHAPLPTPPPRELTDEW